MNQNEQNLVSTVTLPSKRNVNSNRRNRVNRGMKRQDKLLDQIKQTLPVHQINELTKAFKDATDKNHNVIKEAMKRLENQMKGRISMSTVARQAFSKTDTRNLNELKSVLDLKGVDYSDLTDKQLLELTALDDWGTILSMAAPYLQKYGGKALKHLYSKYVKPKVDKWMGGDEGINPLDWGGVMGPRQFRGVQGENIEIPGVKDIFSQVASYNTVDPKSIASVIAPELYKHRYAYTQTQKLALAQINYELSLTTNASGSVGLVIQALNAFSPGSGAGTAFALVFNDSTFSVTTGTQTAAATLVAGPLNAASASISQLRVTTVAVQVIPTASYNTAGAFTLGYQNRKTSTVATTTNCGATLTQLKSFPFVTSFNNKTQSRMINVTGDYADDGFLSSSSGSTSQVFLLLGSGLPASAEVARILVTGIAEFTPDTTALPICIIDYPRPGPLTEQFEAMMFMRFPVVQNLDLQDAKILADALPDNPTQFDHLMNILASKIVGFKPREYVPHMPGQSELVLPGMDSVEFAME